MSIESNDVCDTIASWARAIPAIRRGWLLGGAGGYRPDDEINVAIEVEPVGDSEETLVLWLAHSDRWQSQLQQQTGLPVSLEWFDLDGRTSARAVAGVLIYERDAPIVGGCVIATTVTAIGIGSSSPQQKRISTSSFIERTSTR